MKDLKLQLESYLYLINKLYGENEKRDNRIKNKFANHYTNGMLIENNDFELSIKEIIDLLEEEGLPYELVDATGSISIRI